MATGYGDLARALRWGLIEQEARLDFRSRLFPPGATCACGISDPCLLILRRMPAICYECNLLRRTHSRYELHHIGGHEARIAVLIRGNRLERELDRTGWSR